MAKVYSWEVSSSPKIYAYIVHPNPSRTNEAYVGAELKGSQLQNVIDWASTCTDSEYETQFETMKRLCLKQGYNVEFETVSSYIDVKASCDNLRGPSGRGIKGINKVFSNDNIDYYQIVYDDDTLGDTFTVTNGIKGEKGDRGNDGAPGDKAVSSYFVMVYTGSNTKPSKPNGGSYNFDSNEFTPPSGWDRNDSGFQPPIWMSSATFTSSTANTITSWSEPIQISGENGAPGADGITTEFIYRRDESDLSKEPEVESKNITGDILEGWTASPMGVDEDNQTEWCRSRKLEQIDENNKKWGKWSHPFRWSQYGVNGQDGDGVQYIYLNNKGTVPVNPTPWGYENDSSYQDKDYEWIPKDEEYTNYKQQTVINKALADNTNAGLWTDNPESVTLDYQYQWVCSRKYRVDKTTGKKMWQAFSNPALWAKFGENGKNATSIRKLYTLTENTNEVPEKPKDSVATSQWGTGFPKDYEYGKNVVWAVEAEIWAHNFKFVGGYVIASTTDENGNVVIPSGVTNTNCMEVSSIPDEKLNGIEFVIYLDEYYQWKDGGWSDPYIVTGTKGTDGSPIDYTTYVFGYGYSEFLPGKPQNGSPSEPGVSLDEMGHIIQWYDFIDTSGEKIDGKEEDGYTRKWYQCCGEVDGRTGNIKVDNDGKLKWGPVQPCSGRDGEAMPGRYVEFRFGVTEDEKMPTINGTNDNGEPLREPELFNSKGEKWGWFDTSENMPSIPKGGAMWQIWAQIDGSTEQVLINNGKAWNGPVRISGEKGDNGEPGVQGPAGLRGVTGIPGVSMLQMYCLGTYGDSQTKNYFEGDIRDGYFGDSDFQGKTQEELKNKGWFYNTEIPYTNIIEVTNDSEFNNVTGNTSNIGRVVRKLITKETQSNSGIKYEIVHKYYLVYSSKECKELTGELSIEESENFGVYLWCIQGNEKWQNGATSKYVLSTDIVTSANTKTVSYLPTTEDKNYKYLIYNNSYYTWVNSSYSRVSPKIPNENNTEKVNSLPTSKLEKEFVYYNGNYYEWKDLDNNEIEHISTIEWGIPFKMQGANGLRGLAGNRGQVVYPMGTYNPEEVYWTTETKAPYVYDPDDGMFYVYNIVNQPWVGILPNNYKNILTKDGEYKYSLTGTKDGPWMTDQDGDNPSNNYANNTNENTEPAWVRFESFQALYTSIGIIANGMIGSAVYNNEFMFSQQGIDINGNKTNYAIVSAEDTEYGFLSGYEYDEKGDSNGRHWKYKDRQIYIDDTKVNPYETTDVDGKKIPIHTFRPNVCINFQTGQMWLSAGKISFGASDANIFTKNETTTEIKNSENSLKTLIEEENKEIEEILGKVDNLSEQIDKGVETHYGANDPSSGWTITESGGVNYVENRIGDLWYDTTVNMSYMFVKGDNPDNNTHKDSKIVGYYWRASDVPQSVYDTIDGKSKIYISKPDNSYRTGDLWFIENDSYKNIRFAGGISGITSGTCMVAIAICNGRFSYTDWGKRDKYVSQIEITQATDALSSAITENIEALKSQVDKRAMTYYQEQDPFSLTGENSGITIEQALERVGDLWFCTTAKTSYIFSQKTDIQTGGREVDNDNLKNNYYWSISDVPESVYDKIDGKSQVFIEEPIGPYHVGDLWFVHSDDYKTEKFYEENEDGVTGITKGTCVVCIESSDNFNTIHWGKRDKYVDDATIQQATIELEKYINDTLNDIQLDGVLNSYSQAEDPFDTIDENFSPNSRCGDLWYDTDEKRSYTFIHPIDKEEVYPSDKIKEIGKYPTNNELKSKGYVWAFSNVPESVYDRIDGKSKIFVDEPKAPYNIGDLWYVNSNDYKTEKFYEENENGYVTGITKGTCVVCMTTGGSVEFSTIHWGKRDKYIDKISVQDITASDTAQIKSLIGIYKNQITNKKSKSITAYWSSSDPLKTIDSNTNIPEYICSLWYNTTNNNVYILQGGGLSNQIFPPELMKDNYMYPSSLDLQYTGHYWMLIEAPESIFDKIDGTIKIFVQQPSGGTYSEGDLWITEKQIRDYFYENKNGDKKTITSGTCLICCSVLNGNKFSTKDWDERNKYADLIETNKLNGVIERYGDDGYISPSEQKLLKEEYNLLENDYNSITAQTTAYGISTSNLIGITNQDEGGKFDVIKARAESAFLYYTNRKKTNNVIEDENHADENGFIKIETTGSYKYSNIQNYYLAKAEMLQRINKGITNKISEVEEKVNSSDTEALSYLTTAITDGKSLTTGGLILGNILSVGDIGLVEDGGTNVDETKVTAGINGLASETGETSEKVAFWAGGTLAEAINLVKDTHGQEYSGETANFVVTHDGKTISNQGVFNNAIVNGTIKADTLYTNTCIVMDRRWDTLNNRRHYNITNTNNSYYYVAEYQPEHENYLLDELGYNFYEVKYSETTNQNIRNKIENELNEFKQRFPTGSLITNVDFNQYIIDKELQFEFDKYGVRFELTIRDINYIYGYAPNDDTYKSTNNPWIYSSSQQKHVLKSNASQFYNKYDLFRECVGYSEIVILKSRTSYETETNSLRDYYVDGFESKYWFDGDYVYLPPAELVQGKIIEVTHNAGNSEETGHHAYIAPCDTLGYNSNLFAGWYIEPNNNTLLLGDADETGVCHITNGQRKRFYACKGNDIRNDNKEIFAWIII